MKYFYYAIPLFFCINTFSQNAILGEWFLHYIEVDGIQQYSTVPNSFNNIVFDAAGFNGTVCSNGYSGGYTVIDNATMEITDVTAFAGTCNYPKESQLFLNPYLGMVLSDDDFDNNLFTYSISTTAEDETLIMTNSQNNSAVYGRSPLPENRLPGIWYLHKLVKNGEEQINTFNPEFKIAFSMTPDGVFEGIFYNGLAICNDYFGSYYLEGNDSVRLEYISYTLSFCDLEGYQLEESYFTFMAAQSESILFNYNITGSSEEETLMLTNEIGDYALYGRQALSVSETILNDLRVSLNENPVNDYLKLSIKNNLGSDLNSQIYSIDGKLILEQNVSNEPNIDVSHLNSGMYFLVLSTDNRSMETLKFIKH